MNKAKVTLEGIVPIMLCKYPNPIFPGDTERRKKQTLEEKVWKDDRGMYIPTDNLRMMLIGNRFRTGAAKIQGSVYESKKGKTYVDFCKACVWVVGPDDPMKVYFDPIRQTWDDVDIRAFITSNGGRDVTERPLITTPWSLTFYVHVTDESLPMTKIKKFYEVAGMRCGVGVYGPTFGRFIVKAWDIVD